MKNRQKKTPNAERRTPNGARGTRDIEGKATRVGASELGQRASFNIEWSGDGDRAAERPNRLAGKHKSGKSYCRATVALRTSPLSNHGEVEVAESRKDFLHKLSICLKELRETRRWLRLVARLKLADASNLRACLVETDESIRIFRASVHTTEKNAK
jgi:four helix bundle protein